MEQEDFQNATQPACFVSILQPKEGHQRSGDGSVQKGSAAGREQIGRGVGIEQKGSGAG